MNQLEKDVVKFYKVAMYIKQNYDDTVYLRFFSVMLAAKKVIRFYEIKIPEKIKMKKWVSEYFAIRKKFDIQSIENISFTLDELKPSRKGWCLRV